MEFRNLHLYLPNRQGALAACFAETCPDTRISNFYIHANDKYCPNLDAHRPAFLSARGEMAELIRKKDWGLTSLGPPATWPQSLQTVLALILHSRFPKFIWWGPELLCFYNDAYRPSLGINGKHPSILGQPAAQAWPEIWDIIQPLIAQVLNGDEAIWREDQLVPIYRNGKIEDVYWTFSYSRINNDEGNAYGVLVTCVETTEKVNSKQQLQELTDLLQFSTEAAELGTWDYNPATGRFKANTRLKSWFGLAPEDETDLELALTRIAERDRDRVAAAIALSLDYAQQSPYHIEYSIVHPESGEEKVVLAKGRTFFDTNGEAYRFSGTMEDITEKDKARRMAIQHERDLHDAEERARLAAAAAGLGTFDFHIAGQTTILSPRFLEIFGIEADESHASIISRIYPEDRPVREAAHAKALETGLLYYEARIRKTNGSLAWIRVEGRVLHDQEGRPIRIVGSVLDFTEKKEIEQQREEYIAIASHELKNPLTSLKLALDLMGSDAGNLQQQVLLGKSREQVQRLIRMTGELLNVAKIAAGELAVQREVVNLKQCISESISTARSAGGDHEFVVTGTPDVNIPADRFRIEQVLTNLLGNACKYSPRGSQIVVDVSFTTSQVMVKVTDKGIGIDADKTGLLFRKFSRVEPLRAIQGHGLGLYISAQIIRSHGGQIGVESEKGMGSVFWFSLPR